VVVQGFLPYSQHPAITTAFPSFQNQKGNMVHLHQRQSQQRRRQQQQQQKRPVSTFLYMLAKSGGKLITSTEQYVDMVLSPNVPKPVMVFFTAPW
jgi:hypothetical protein